MKRTIWVDTKSRVAIILIRRARARAVSLSISLAPQETAEEKGISSRESSGQNCFDVSKCWPRISRFTSDGITVTFYGSTRLDSTRPRKPWTNRVFQIFFVFSLVFSWLIYFILFCDTYSVAKREPKNEGVTTSVLCAHVIPVGSGLFSHV